MTSGQNQKIISATNPAEPAPRTIRGDHAIEIGRNIIHVTDSGESARRRLHCGSPMVLLTGSAAFSTGSIDEKSTSTGCCPSSYSLSRLVF
ncbi:hypothetical protein D8674_042916 [Pyrus ussuriensis x Pyrus communis]|uniref:Nucleoside diphosphate kinase-like domain-containing protein n=1 Tax=Pyrus ussuriensis x Pyrus communis TaxID=2448454 RepID=A0A5N5I642_9ROSA|nr:hypothetical protein D8674_042916 [Pyrus ussuriensis x Pyrus communis]